MSHQDEKARLAAHAADYAANENCTGIVVVASFKDGTSRFHVSPFPDSIAKACLAVGLCGAGGLVAGAAIETQRGPKATA